MAFQPGDARTGGVRLVLGMVRANRPWWLVTDLSTALAAALATAAFSVVTNTIWGLGDTMGWARLLALGIASVAVLVVWLIVAHDLWEPSADHTDAWRIRVANAVTVLTLVIGVTCFYVALFVLVLVSAPRDHRALSPDHPGASGWLRRLRHPCLDHRLAGHDRGCARLRPRDG
jgi:hypothetical protein